MSFRKILGTALALGAPVLVSLSAPACSTVPLEPCAGLPSCTSDEVQVDSCDGDPGCREEELCGEVIYCSPAAQCDAVPTCDPDQSEYTNCPVGEICEERTLCGMTILCGPRGPCLNSSECLPDEFCDFRDGECGAGVAGECKPRPTVCTDGPGVCYCDGTLTMNGDFGCEGWDGKDLDSTGTACTFPATAIPCGHLVCDSGTDDFCRITADDTGGAPYVDCSFAPPGCDPATCACLTAETEACGGTCTDGPNGPTITCPGG
jgi:hypothetical protein